MRALAGRLALVLLGLGAGLVLVEIALRLLPPRPVADLRGFHEARLDRPWLYGLKPGSEGQLAATGDVHYAINADGFRDRLYPRQKPPGTFRIVVLGDSIAFGYGVAELDTFPEVLEATLNTKGTGQRSEVLNLGVNGYNPYNEAALFADVGAAYQPDLVLVEFCVNDLNDPTLHFDASTRLALGDIPDAAFPDPARRREKARPPSVGTRLCALLRTCAAVSRFLLARSASTPSPADWQAALALPSGTGPELAWLRARYDEIAERAAASGARFAVALVPHQAMVEGRAPGTLHERLVTLGREAGWVTVDLLPAFRQASDVEPLFLDAWHPSRAGHRVAADAILTRLACAGLLPLAPGPGLGCEAAASVSNRTRTSSRSSPAASTFTM